MGDVEVVEDCSEHKNAHEGAVTEPYKFTINQRFAKELWQRGEPMGTTGRNV